MKQYLPFVLAGLVGGGVYDGAKTLVQRGINSEPGQRVIGMFRSYDPEKVNPQNCKIIMDGTIQWGNNHVKFTSPPYDHRPTDWGKTTSDVQAWYMGQDYIGRHRGAPVNAAIKPEESAGQSATIIVRTATFDKNLDRRCRPTLVILENRTPVRGGKLSSYSSGQQYVKEVRHLRAGTRDYVAQVTVNGVVEEFPLGRIHFTGNPFDTPPNVSLYYSGGGDRLSVHAIDYGDNRGEKLREVKVTENGKPVTLESLFRSSGEGFVEENWKFKPLQLGVNTYTIEGVDKGGNKVTATKAFDVETIDNRLRISEVKSD